MRFRLTDIAKATQAAALYTLSYRPFDTCLSAIALLGFIYSLDSAGFSQRYPRPLSVVDIVSVLPVASFLCTETVLGKRDSLYRENLANK